MIIKNDNFYSLFRFFYFLLFFIFNFSFSQTDGSIDGTFNPVLSGANSNARIVHAIQQDGKIIIAGYELTTYNGVTINGIARLNTDGTIDPTFNTGSGLMPLNGFSPSVTDIDIQSDGKIVIAGIIGGYNGTVRKRILRINTNGAIDTSFNAGTGVYAGDYADGYPQKILVLPTNEIILYGSIWKWNNVTVSGLIKLNSNGSINTAFNSNVGNGPGGSFVKDIKLRSDGKILLVGNFLNFKSVSVKGIVLINQSGTTDNTFSLNPIAMLYPSPGGGTATSNVNSVVVESDNKMTIAGQFYVGGVVKSVARLNSNGSLDATFAFYDSNLTNSSRIVKDLSSNKYIVYSPLQYTGQKQLVRILNNGSNDSSFSLSPNITQMGNYSYTMMTIDSSNKILFSGMLQANNGSIKVAITRLGMVPVLQINANPDNGISNNGVASTPISNVLINDTYNSLPANSTNTTLSFINSTNAGVTLNTSTGSVNVSSSVPVGTYTLTYQICASVNPSNCSTAIVTIIVKPNIFATEDFGNAIPGVASTPILNVLQNDTYNLNQATLSNVTLSLDYADEGLSLNTATGAVSVSSTLGDGLGGITLYTLTYSICSIEDPSNCSTTQVTISLSDQVDAVNDSGNVTFGIGGTAIPNIRVNDTINNLVATSSNSTITLLSPPSGISLNPMTGALIVSSAVPVGVYTITYKLCKRSTTICDTATITITVSNPTPESVNGIRANNLVDKVELQSNGKIIISGYFTTYNNISTKRIARLNTDLTLDPTFNTAGSDPEGHIILDMVVMPDDNILVVSRANMTGFNGGSNGAGIAKLLPNGNIDTSFNISGSGLNGSSANYKISACAVQATDGRILIGGSWMDSFNGSAVKNMIRLYSDGSIDDSFDYHYLPVSVNGSNYSNNAIITKIVPLADGTIIVGGGRSGVSNGQKSVFKLMSDGSLDEGFAVGDAVGEDPFVCYSCISSIQNIIVQPDGKIIVVGSFNTYNGEPFKNIVRLFPNGQIDYSFDPGASCDRVINDVEYDPIANKYYIAGEFSIFNGIPVNRLARLTSTGSLDMTFNIGTGTSHTNTSNPIYNNINVLKRQNDGKVIIGGIFTSYNGISATNITRIVPTVNGGQGRTSSVLWESEPEIDINTYGIDVSIYPNPSNGIFNLDLTNVNKNYNSIEVYNVLGQLVFKDKILIKNVNTFNLSNIPDGYYIAKITNGVDSIQRKIIKKQ